MYPDTCVRTGNQVGGAPAAELTPETTLYPYALAHPDLFGQRHAPVAPFRVLRVKLRGTRKEKHDSLTGKPSGA
jgi:hypothetical protein